jgi:hypothetical protein
MSNRHNITRNPSAAEMLTDRFPPLSVSRRNVDDSFAQAIARKLGSRGQVSGASEPRSRNPHG